MFNIIGDVAGRYDELMELVKIMPDAPFIFCGDLNDRGPESAKVIDWVMKNARSVHSNHGQMMVDYYYGDDEKYQGKYLFQVNGGVPTILSYFSKEMRDCVMLDITSGDSESARDLFLANADPKHIEWLRTRPYYIEEDGLFISHAPRFPMASLEVLSDPYKREGLLWNRGKPKRLPDQFQIYGHNTHFTNHSDSKGLYAMCIDDSGKGKLTGVHFADKKPQQIYQVFYKE